MSSMRACAILLLSLFGAAPRAYAADSPSPVQTRNMGDIIIIGVRNTPADSLEYVGFSAYSEGVYGDAEQAFLDAIEESKQGRSRSITSLAQLYSNLAWLYLEEERFAEADSVMMLAVKFDRAGDKAGIDTAWRTLDFAMLQQAEGRHGAAAPLLDEVLEFQAKNSKKFDAREVAFTLHLLARNYRATGDLKKGESAINEAIRNLDQNSAVDKSQWAAAMLELAELYHATHRDHEAREAFEKALNKANELYAAGGLDNALVLDPYRVLERRAKAAGATSDSARR
jgi:tetratricopeptide (TPR) repeat protein